MIKNFPIKISIKIKPCDQKKDIIVKGSQGNNKLIMKQGLAQKVFKVNSIHDANVSEKTAFVDCNIAQLIQKFLQGYNTTFMAYGQTGAGKTYVMQGKQNQKGIIEESIEYIFRNLADCNKTMKCSFFQIYNQKSYDLLNNVEIPLKMRWQAEKDFILEQLTWKQCKNKKQLLQLWKIGRNNKIIASNRINQMSSRSHTLFTITLQTDDQDGNYCNRQLLFVDLAGSERLNNPIDRLSKESIQINKSLFSLRKVIKSLQQNTINKKQNYIPYRDSQLTSLLKKAIGGNCVTLIIACINATFQQKQQTLQTLNYAVSAGRIKNHISIQIDKKAQQLRYLKQMNKKLQNELELATKQVVLFQKFHKDAQNKKNENSEFQHRIIQCISTVRELLQSNKQLREELEIQKLEKIKMQKEIRQLKRDNFLLKKNKRISVDNQQKESIEKINYNKSNKKPIQTDSIPLYGSSMSVERFRTQKKGLKLNPSILRRTKFKLIKTQQSFNFNNQVKN